MSEKTFVCKYSAAEINKAIEALALPTAIQGVEEWKGSREIGGNVAAHLAAVNGKAVGVGVCQVFGDFFFGAESRANILKGIKSVRVRRAFEVSTADTIRLPRALTAAEMLTFYRAFERARMELTPLVVKVEAAPEAAPVEAAPVQAETLGHAAALDTLKSERIKTAARIKALRAANRALREQVAMLQASLAVKKAKKATKVEAVA